MKIIAGLFVLALCASGGVSQEHAPTVDMCRPDAALWYGHEMATEYYNAQSLFNSDGVPNRTDSAKLPLSEAIARMQEMFKCQRVDEQRKDNYLDVQLFYHEVMADRCFRFILRHHLKDQLDREDAQGIR